MGENFIRKTFLPHFYSCVFSRITFLPPPPRYLKRPRRIFHPSFFLERFQQKPSHCRSHAGPVARRHVSGRSLSQTWRCCTEQGLGQRQRWWGIRTRESWLVSGTGMSIVQQRWVRGPRSGFWVQGLVLNISGFLKRYSLGPFNEDSRPVPYTAWSIGSTERVSEILRLLDPLDVSEGEFQTTGYQKKRRISWELGLKHSEGTK